MKTLSKIMAFVVIIALNSSPIYSEPSGCDDFSWSCNNPYGDCGELAAQYGNCTLICTYSGFWVYCDGLDNPE